MHLPCQALLEASRALWSMESQLHWRLDVGMREDECPYLRSKWREQVCEYIAAIMPTCRKSWQDWKFRNFSLCFNYLHRAFMATLIFYNVILFSSTFFLWLSEKGRTKLDRGVFLSIAFFLVFIPVAIRYDVGTDYLNYLAIYKDVWRTPLEDYKLREPAFYFLNWLFRSVDAHFQWIFATYAFIFTTVAFKSYPQKNIWFFHLLFIAMVWFFSFNGIRQAIAISFCILGVSYYLKRKHIGFFICVFLAFLFHKSSIVILIVGLLAMLPASKLFKEKLFPYTAIGLTCVSYISTTFILPYIESSLLLLGMNNYSNYFSGGEHFAEAGGSGLSGIVKIFFSIYVLSNVKYFLKLSDKYWLLMMSIALYSLSAALASHIIIFSRMLILFDYAPLFLCYILYSNNRFYSLNKMLAILFVVFYLITFEKLSLGIPSDYADPKRNPYQTIFNSEINYQ